MGSSDSAGSQRSDKFTFEWDEIQKRHRAV